MPMHQICQDEYMRLGYQITEHATGDPLSARPRIDTRHESD
jgi:hypothetical protein